MTMNSNIDATHAVTINSLQKIIYYIEENIAEPLTPAVIARQFFLSVSSINILFRVVCDITVMEYIPKQTAYTCRSGALNIRYPHH